MASMHRLDPYSMHIVKKYCKKIIQFEKLAIFNGLGTKGYMIGPLLAKEFVDYLLEGNELDQEVKLERFFNKVNF